MASQQLLLSRSLLFKERHLAILQSNMQQLKSVLDDSDDHQVVLTDIYQTIWEALQCDFNAHNNNKKVKSSRHESELLGVMKSSLQSLIGSVKEDLELETQATTNLSALSVLEENDPGTASLTRAEGLVFQAYMERGYQLEAERQASRRSFEKMARMHDGHGGDNVSDWSDYTTCLLYTSDAADE